MDPKVAELFIRNFNHEIKNPLTTIKGYTQLLSLKGNDPAFREKAQSIIVGQVQRIEDSFASFYSLFSMHNFECSPTSVAALVSSVSAALQQCEGTVVKNLCPEDMSVSSNLGIVLRSIDGVVQGFRWKDYPDTSLSVNVAAEGKACRIVLSFGKPVFSLLDDASFMIPYASARVFTTGIELFSSYYLLSGIGASFSLNDGRDGFTVMLP